MTSTEHPGTNEQMAYCEACNQQAVESVSSRRYSHEDMHDAEQRAFIAGLAEAEQVAVERIAAWLEAGDEPWADEFANAVRRGDWKGKA